MISAYLVDNFIIKKWNGTDKWGEPNAYTQINIKGKIIYKTRGDVFSMLIRNIKGEEIISSAMIYFPKRNIDALLGRALSHEDRIQINGENKDHTILRINIPKAFSDPYYKVYIA